MSLLSEESKSIVTVDDKTGAVGIGSISDFCSNECSICQCANEEYTSIKKCCVCGEDHKDLIIVYSGIWSFVVCPKENKIVFI